MKQFTVHISSPFCTFPQLQSMQDFGGQSGKGTGFPHKYLGCPCLNHSKYAPSSFIHQSPTLQDFTN
jgi:hypothetical protein